MNDRKVAIFWDYENCPVLGGCSGHQAVKSIRGAIQPFGSIKLFKAYFAISESHTKSVTLRSELQASGVSLTDTPHNGQKDVADKMIIVDMLLYAMDNPAPATVVLISGDKDYAYAISVLRLRQYDVVVLTPPNASPSLTSHATVCLAWNKNVLASGFEPLPTATVLPPQMPNAGQPAAPASPTIIRPQASTVPSLDQIRNLGEVSLENYFERRPSIVGLPPPPRYEPERRISPPTELAPPTSTSTPATPAPPKRWARADSTSSIASFVTCQSSLSGGQSSSSGGDSRSQSAESWSEADVRANGTQQSTALRPESPSTARAIRTASLSFLFSPERTPLGSLPPRDTSSVELESRSATQLSPSPRSVTLSPELLLSHRQDASTSTYSLSPKAATSSPSVPQSTLTARDFKPLIKILQGYYARGITEAFRPSVAVEVLTADKSIYTVLPPGKPQTFGSYAELAMSSGIVDIGGSGGETWISLRPQYRDIDVDSL
ncbi:EDA32 [Coprinopsis cinerea okayama7|uniref:EDA32 n=1 Tax=Coprinopsis cinerea (strain Okayama-7 / 130 / ATCC MYA-4618 / FGSC 9003) TaxID=240176 RepID=A8NH06_COPC7|nr:EDA32 [Coprinopsis cinerea okayama7\|eukprot:XP_001833647.2 EDA32 [Coprinopsis cinerea okayama7\